MTKAQTELVLAISQSADEVFPTAITADPYFESLFRALMYDDDIEVGRIAAMIILELDGHGYEIEGLATSWTAVFGELVEVKTV